MKRRGIAALALLCLATTVVAGEPGKDEQALRALPQAFAQAWARHDGAALAGLMAQDVEFVTAGATWLHGRADFRTYHTRLLTGRFRQSQLTPLATRVRMLRPDLALVHWSWSMVADRNADGSARAPRFGLMTMVVARQTGGWLIVAAQNSNGANAPAPEEQGIELPIVVPPAGAH